MPGVDVGSQSTLGRLPGGDLGGVKTDCPSKVRLLAPVD